MRIVAVVGTYRAFRIWSRCISGVFNEMQKTIVTETNTTYIHFSDPKGVKSWFIDDFIELYGCDESSIIETIKAVKLRIEQTKGR